MLVYTWFVQNFKRDRFQQAIFQPYCKASQSDGVGIFISGNLSDGNCVELTKEFFCFLQIGSHFLPFCLVF